IDIINGTAASSVARKPLKNPSFPTWQEPINLSAIPLPSRGEITCPLLSKLHLSEMRLKH
ncbi:hypothetical protein, partial [Mesorhizobium caraganae]|uniref:hypothetical protein n=1 Tax=Mesorhizobium caraganae TaxID=483206 RepID=UPI001AEFDCC1